MRRGSGKGRDWSFGTPDQKWDRDKLQEGPKGKAFSIMIWEAFWGSERSDLHLLERDWDSKKQGYSAKSYIQVLESNLLGIWTPGLVFMQDNAPIHGANKTKAWFKEWGIEVMDWPPYSPDLNPIENLWALLKKEAYKVYPDINSLEGKGDEAESKLFSILQEAWGNIREEVIDGLIASMPRRMAALIAAEGWHTKYQHLQIRVANRAHINRLSMQFWRFQTVVWGVGNRWNKCPVKGNFGFGGVCRRLLHI